MTLRLSLPAEPLAAREARRAVSAWARSHDLYERLDDLELVTSELVTNATVHGLGPVIVELYDKGQSLRLQVTDSGALAPSPRLASSEDDSGRGLMIVAALALAWGSSVNGSVTQVWAELAISPE
jgi:anti-sigma regulatory factor (Ser/Thr protein kinase)